MRRRGEPEWLRLDVVIALHKQLVAEHGGSTGLRDQGLLESALARPRNHLLYAEGDDRPTMARLAASYAFALVRDHAFVDGNKRVGLVVAATFLLLNGYELIASEADAVAVIMALADGSLSEAQLADWFESHSRRRAGTE